MDATNGVKTSRIAISILIIWIIDAAFTFLTCGWLFKWIYEIPPIIWLEPAETMSTGNMTISILAGLFKSMLFVLVFVLLYDGVPGKGVAKGLLYGFLIWMVGALSAFMTMPLYMTIAPATVAYWIVQAAAIGLVNGAVVGGFIRKFY